MKPSNTGIEWGKRRSMWAEGFGHHHKIADASIHAIAEWAIAEYRKEAKAEWQRELVAKVARMDADTTDPEMIPSEFLNYKYGWNDAIRTFRVLLNENDDE